MSRLLFLLALMPVVLTASCAHSVRMISVPAGAKITIDDQKLGEAPVLYTERSGAPTRTYKIKAELPGRPPIIREETVRLCTTPANLIMTAYVVGFPIGFCLRDEYVFDFTAQAGGLPHTPPPTPSSTN